jgi:hypothetical protein
MTMFNNSLKSLLYDAVIYVGGIVTYLLYMQSPFDGF